MTAHARLSPCHRIGVHLSAEDQTLLDALVTVHGEGKASRLLGIARDAVERLAFGGHAQPARVARMTEALAAWAESHRRIA